MRTCDTCGAALRDEDPFVVCPRCLFSGALSPEAAPPASLLPPAPDLAQAADLLARFGERSDFLERYEVLERMGRGGQGEVLRTWDFRLRRMIALKRLGELEVDRAPAVSRFLAEAQITAQLQHPGILPIHDVGIDLDGRPFFTTDLLPGTTLDDVFADLRRGRKEVAEGLSRALELLIRVCEIVAHAHSRGVIHRDLKPGNILVGRFNDIRVIDWGSAEVSEAARKEMDLRLPPVQTDRGDSLSREPDSPLASRRSGHPVTILFTPPECFQEPPPPVTPAVDVYAVGVMLYEVCTGRKPYAGKDGRIPEGTDLRQCILDGPPAAIHELRPGIPRDVAAIGAKAMARNPAERYAELTALAADLRAYLEIRPVQARPAGWTERFQKWVRRHSLAVAWASVAVSIGGLLLAAAVRRDAEARRAQAQATLQEQLKLLRDAEIAARKGQWQASLDGLKAAEQAGYPDRFDLAVRRYDAWVVLWEPNRARAEIRILSELPDLGPERRALVKLRTGEFELFDAKSYEAGIRHIREALEIGLEPAEAAFARGIVAPTTEEALRGFQETLALNPYHHAAHRHSLGLEMLCARREQLASHVRVLRGLYPGDPSADFAEALGMAFDGDLAGAHQVLDRVRPRVGWGTYRTVRAVFDVLGLGLSQFDVECYLGERVAPPFDVDQLVESVPGLLVTAGLAVAESTDSRLVRVPQLPCIRSGLEPWKQAVLEFVQAEGVGPLDFGRILAGWEAHHEALFPYGVAYIEEQRTPAERQNGAEFVRRQSELYDRAANSFSVYPRLPRLARYRAAEMHFRLARQGAATNAAICLGHVRKAVSLPDSSRGELRGYFGMALELGDLPLASELFARWERVSPRDARLRRDRIRLAIATGALGPALEQLDGLLGDYPNDAWAREQRDRVLADLRRLAGIIPAATSASPVQPR